MANHNALYEFCRAQTDGCRTPKAIPGRNVNNTLLSEQREHSRVPHRPKPFVLLLLLDRNDKLEIEPCTEFNEPAKCMHL